jgi:hypothetical protein
VNDPLTVSEVLAILSSSGTDTTRLEFREEAGCVVVTGPARDRGEATGVLFAAGLAHAPYGDRDEWLRRQGPEAVMAAPNPRPDICPECTAPGDRIAWDGGAPPHGDDHWRCDHCGASWSTPGRPWIPPAGTGSPP